MAIYHSVLKAQEDSYVGQPWLMHHIDRQYWNHNSLGPGDVDGDGHPEFVLTDGGESERVDFLVEWDGRRLVHLGSVALGD